MTGRIVRGWKKTKIVRRWWLASCDAACAKSRDIADQPVTTQAPRELYSLPWERDAPLPLPFRSATWARYLPV